MRELLNWVAAKFTSLRPFLTPIINSVIPAPLQVNLKDGLYQAWCGVRYLADSEMFYTLQDSHETQKVITESLYTNMVLYAAPAMLYEGVMSFLQDKMDSESYFIWMVSAIGGYMIMRSRIRMMVDNVAYTAVVSQVATDEQPPQQHLHACGCGPTKSFIADLISTWDYAIDMLTVYGVSYIPIYGKNLSFFLRAYIYGRSALDYKFSAMGICNQHRNELEAKNKIYSLSVGTTFLAAVETLTALTQYITGVKSPFVYNAIFNSLFQYCLIHATWLDKPLPGQKKGMDVFYFSHLLVGYLKQGSQCLWSYLHPTTAKMDVQQIVKNISEFPSVNWILTGLFYNDLQDMNVFVKKPAIHLYLNTYEAKIKYGPEFVKYIRDQKVAYFFSVLPLDWWVFGWISDERRQSQTLVGVALDKNLDIVVALIESLLEARANYLREIESAKEAAQIKVVKYDEVLDLTKVIKEKDYIPPVDVQFEILPPSDKTVPGKINLITILRDDYDPAQKPLTTTIVRIPSAIKPKNDAGISSLRQNSVFPPAEIKQRRKVLLPLESQSQLKR